VLRVSKFLKEEGVIGFILFLVMCSVVWAVFLSIFWGLPFIPHPAPDDDTMHRTVIYFMIGGEDFYTAWRHTVVVCADPGDLRIFRTPIIFYMMTALVGWAGPYFQFPLGVVCVLFAASNLILSFWTAQKLLGSGWAGLTAAITQYAYFFNVIPKFQISIFAMPFLILGVYWAWEGKVWHASGSLALSFLIKESFGFAFPAILLLFLLRRNWRAALILTGTFVAAGCLYLLHLYVAQPIGDPNMLFAEPPLDVLINIGGFLWFGFGVLYYNVFLPVTIGGAYPFSPIPPFLPYPLFLVILGFQFVFVWVPLLLLCIEMIHRRKLLYSRLLILGLVLWIVPVVISATTPVTDFTLWWVDFGVYRWFAAAYVGFQLLVGVSWHQLRKSLKERKTQTWLSAQLSQLHKRLGRS
jgi:hypothetical protein